MRVCFDSRPAADPRGIGRSTRCLLDALRAVAARHGGEMVEGRQPRRGDDVFHAPWMNGALLHPRVPMVVTVHDLVSQKHAGQTLRAGLRDGMRRLAIERAARVICPSRAVAEDTAELMRVAAERIEVIAEAPAEAFRPRPAAEVAAARASHGVPEDYLLWVGDLRHPDPHRRIPALVHAPRDLPLVLVGAAGQWAHELDGGVIVTGEVADAELAALYTGAHALVLPSPEEGFGLPGVEALACGTPVVAADGPALREVLEGRATFVDAGDVAGLLSAAHAAQRPAPASPAWTWADAAAATWAVYERALAGA
jgi:glycosyltransferase involved in cell wall biosynthesis